MTSLLSGARDNFLQQRSLSRARDVRDQLVKLCDRVELKVSSDNDPIKIRKAISSGYFQNACRLNRDGQSYRTVKSGLAGHVHPSSVLTEDAAKPKWVLYYELVLTSKEFMRSVMPIEPEWLVEVGTALL